MWRDNWETPPRPDDVLDTAEESDWAARDLDDAKWDAAQNAADVLDDARRANG